MSLDVLGLRVGALGGFGGLRAWENLGWFGLGDILKNHILISPFWI